MKLLLDTHAALWWLDDDKPIGKAADRELLDDRNHRMLSAVVVWEVAIKRALGKLHAPDGFAETLLEAGVDPLPVTLEHAASVERLPHHHGDPFDRMLVAQATIEDAVIVTRDAALACYGVPLLW